MNMPAADLTKGVRAADLRELGGSIAFGPVNGAHATSGVYLRLPAKFAMALGIASGVSSRSCMPIRLSHGFTRSKIWLLSRIP